MPSIHQPWSDHSDPAHEARSFLELLFDGAPENLVTRITRRPIRGATTARWAPPSDLDGFEDYRSTWTGRADLSVGPTLFLPAGRDGRRIGQAVDVVATRAIVLDLDVWNTRRGASQELLPSTMEELLKIIHRCPLPPTLLVATGGGIQPWWLLDDFVDLTGQHERATHINIRHRLALLFRNLTRPEGYQIDEVGALALSYRLPGSINLKYGEEVRWGLYSGAFTYTHASLNEDLPGDPVPSKREPAAGASRKADPAASEVGATSPADSDLGRIFAGCAFMRYARDDQASLIEPVWRAALSIVRQTHAGLAGAIAISQEHPKFKEAETREKFERATRPYSCDQIAHLTGGVWCAACPSRTRISTPVQIGRMGVASSKPTSVPRPKAIVEIAHRWLIAVQDQIYRGDAGTLDRCMAEQVFADVIWRSNVVVTLSKLFVADRLLVSDETGLFVPRRLVKRGLLVEAEAGEHNVRRYHISHPHDPSLFTDAQAAQKTVDSGVGPQIPLTHLIRGPLVGTQAGLILRATQRHGETATLDQLRADTQKSRSWLYHRFAPLVEAELVSVSAGVVKHLGVPDVEAAERLGISAERSARFAARLEARAEKERKRVSERSPGGGYYLQPPSLRGAVLADPKRRAVMFRRISLSILREKVDAGELIESDERFFDSDTMELRATLDPSTGNIRKY